MALRLLFDYLARHTHLPQSAAQIEIGIRTDKFYVEHATGARNFTRSIPRSYIRVYIERLRSAISNALREAGLQMDASSILLTQEKMMNEVGYKLKATIQITHIHH